MRNAEPQTKSGGNNKWVKIHKPVFDGHITNVESPRTGNPQQKMIYPTHLPDVDYKYS